MLPRGGPKAVPATPMRSEASTTSCLRGCLRIRASGGMRSASTVKGKTTCSRIAQIEHSGRTLETSRGRRFICVLCTVRQKTSTSIVNQANSHIRTTDPPRRCSDTWSTTPLDESMGFGTTAVGIPRSILRFIVARPLLFPHLSNPRFTSRYLATLRFPTLLPCAPVRI